jgi:hypothetical protein
MTDTRDGGGGSVVFSGGGAVSDVASTIRATPLGGRTVACIINISYD